MIELIKTSEEDLKTLFVLQLDKDSNWMAAFTSENPEDKKAYMDKWTKIVHNPNIRMQTIRINDAVIGSVIHFDIMNETNVSYWIDKKHWGKGIATEALTQFIETTERRPLFGRVAHDNIGSQRVLEKSGFKRIGKEMGYANARKKEIEEFIYTLE